MSVYKTSGLEFFASANGYGGFKSYFSEIFDPYKFTRIFILKGGPGTGKSSILKKLCKYAEESNLYYEIFRCSSDPASLDAVIIKNGKYSVAVLDGTAPHERDACIPGAADEIINLGKAWNKKELCSARKEIESLNKSKSNAYKNAYRYLSISSIFNKNIKAEIANHFDFCSAKKECEDLFELFKDSKDNELNTRLISSFSKDGYKRNICFEENVKANYKITGKYETSNLLLSILSKMLIDNNMNFTIIPSPLDEDNVEGIYLKEKNAAIISNNSENQYNDIVCNASKFIKSDFYIKSENMVNKFEEHRNFYQTLAAKELSLASEYHFMLEKIYTPLMDFSIIDNIFDELLENIKNIFTHII